MINKKKGYLVLETGEVFEGLWHENNKAVPANAGELVFNTSHAGYQEIASDPSYFGQIMVMTAPMMGNYGKHTGDWESKKYWIEGFVCLEMETRDETWILELLKAGIPVLSEVDTRALTLRLREGGAVWGGVCAAESAEQAREILAKVIADKKKLNGQDWTAIVCSREQRVVKGSASNNLKIAVLDFGCKENIIREMAKRVGEVCVFPSHSSPKAIREYNPSGILLSNGPGDPAWVQRGTETVRELIGWRPIFGICMGHQVLSQALGAKTFKMKFGHHGGNHPVQDLMLEKIYITSQNHGYAVDPKTLPEGTRVTQTNLYDNSVEGFEYPQKKCFSVQYHPESAPGPNDARNLFDVFVGSLK
jgi:carbamoyl-phosphate synthase small subunit